METTCGGSGMNNFECPRCGHCCQSEVSLRDYFAGKAMQVFFEHYDIPSSFEDSEVNDPEGMPSLIAIDAYVMADAMLKARER